MKKLIKDKLEDLESLHAVTAYKLDQNDKNLQDITKAITNIEKNNKLHLWLKVGIISLIILDAIGLLNILDVELVMNLLLS